MRRSMLFLAGLAAGAAILTGCRSRPAAAFPEGAILATYSGRTLRADLPAPVRVPSLTAAAAVALRARGYTIEEAEATEDSGEVVARPPDAAWLERVVVDANLRGGRPRVRVTVEPLGNQRLSRSLLDAILAEVGL